jgi:hypothetical protein
MKNISREDFVIWNYKDRKLIEDSDTVYHYTTIIEMINTFQLSLQDNQELICVAELPLRLQEEISNAIELTK